MISPSTPHATPSTSRLQRPLENVYYDYHARDSLATTSAAAPPLLAPSTDSSQSSLSLSSSPSLSAASTQISPSAQSDATSINTSLIMPSKTVTVTEGVTGSTPFGPSVLVSPLAVSALPAFQTTLSNFQVQPVCIGHGLDAQSLGLISTVVVPSVLGILIWVSVELSSRVTRSSDTVASLHLHLLDNDTGRSTVCVSGLFNKSAFYPPVQLGTMPDHLQAATEASRSFILGVSISSRPARAKCPNGCLGCRTLGCS